MGAYATLSFLDVRAYVTLSRLVVLLRHLPNRLQFLLATKIVDIPLRLFHRPLYLFRLLVMMLLESPIPCRLILVLESLCHHG